jgi:hypothetical protein
MEFDGKKLTGAGREPAKPSSWPRSLVSWQAGTFNSKSSQDGQAKIDRGDSLGSSPRQQDQWCPVEGQ